MSERQLDLSTDQARADASKALPALMWASALGNAEASAMAGQIIGQSITDALAPSFAALARLRAAEVRSTDTTNQEGCDDGT